MPSFMDPPKAGTESRKTDDDLLDLSHVSDSQPREYICLLRIWAERG